jgi:malate dehydrogenase (oxaloacetate-decarboxylating)(NADP+)
MVNQDRNVFGACMVAMGDADSLVSGLTRSFNDTLNHITRVISPKNDKNIIGMCMIVNREKTVFIGDTNILERPRPEELADVAEKMAFTVSKLGYKPRVAFASFANFGSPSLPSTSSAREAVKILKTRSIDFEFDGEMSVEIALNFNLMKKNYPFCNLSDEANILVMPGLHSANISFKLLQNLGGGSVIGPILLGSEFPIQIVQMGSTVNEITNAAIFSAYDAL